MDKESEKELFGNLVLKGKEDRVKEMIVSGVDLDAPESNGMTPLILAVEGDQPQILELLLESGANPNKTDSAGLTALHWAVDGAFDGMVQNNRNVPFQEPLECIKILLKYGADKNIKDNSGETPLDYLMTEEIRNILME